MSIVYLDSLYGPCSLPSELEALVRSPAVQRLREIRLSNIDSLSMPGFANISRYEHALGTAHLATTLNMRQVLTDRERLVMQAAALLHDSAISPFGHLIEEAFGYASISACHESRWGLLLAKTDTSIIGGIRSQFYLGRHAGLDEWALKLTSNSSILQEIFDAITGKGKVGPLICGAIDLDNLDNVTRAAFHAGILTDRELAKRIAASIVSYRDGMPVFLSSSLSDINGWLELRAKLYDHLMFSWVDFVGKSMLLYATLQAIEAGYITTGDWLMTDREFVNKMLQCRDDVSLPVKCWLLGDLWPFTGILSLEGKCPTLEETRSLGEQASKILKRDCFAYRIKDKRSRPIQVSTECGKTVNLGSVSKLWFLGFVSRKRTPFTKRELSALRILVGEFYPESHIVGDFRRDTPSVSEPPSYLPSLL